MARRKGRGRLTAIDKLPPECGPIIVWASEELRDRDRTAQDIYEEFFTKCGELMADSHGEIEFQIPSRSSFNRYSLKLAAATRRLEDTRKIAEAVAGRFDAEASDDLVLLASEAIKTLVWELLENAGEAGIDPKGAMNLANALRSAMQAQAVSSERRRKIEQAFAAKVNDAVGKAAKAGGITSETAEEIIGKILGKA